VKRRLYRSLYRLRRRSSVTCVAIVYRFSVWLDQPAISLFFLRCCSASRGFELNQKQVEAAAMHMYRLVCRFSFDANFHELESRQKAMFEIESEAAKH
jgi:hypothetical protein